MTTHLVSYPLASYGWDEFTSFINSCTILPVLDRIHIHFFIPSRFLQKSNVIHFRYMFTVHGGGYHAFYDSFEMYNPQPIEITDRVIKHLAGVIKLIENKG